ncbi:MAG TPA: GspH/FimT family pseudopilin [Gammaproteobacteria bacterium]
MKNEHGFTLLELMVVLAIAGILMMVAVPNFKTTIADNRQVAAINELLGTLMYARSEAITDNKSITVCASSDSATCNSTDWSQGWIVYATAGTPLRVHGALANGLTLNNAGIGSSFTFSTNGTSTVSGLFTLCDSRGSSFARSLNLISTGLAKASQTVGKAPDGTALSCPT